MNWYSHCVKKNIVNAIQSRFSCVSVHLLSIHPRFLLLLFLVVASWMRSSHFICCRPWYNKATCQTARIQLHHYFRHALGILKSNNSFIPFCTMRRQQYWGDHRTLRPHFFFMRAYIWIRNPIRYFNRRKFDRYFVCVCLIFFFSFTWKLQNRLMCFY